MINSKSTTPNRAYLLCILIFIISVSCLIPIVQAATTKTAYDWNTEGDSLFDAGRYSEALGAFNSSLSINPNDANVWYNKGITLARLGRYSEALDAFNSSLSITPNDADSLYEKGFALDYLGRYSEALDAFNSSLSITPNNANAWNNKGYALDHLGRYSEALDAFNISLSITPNDANAWNNKGYALDHLGRYQDALNAYNKALSIDPNYAIAQVNKNNLLTKIGTIQTTVPATITTNVTQTPTPSPTATYSRRGDSNFIFSIIEIPVLLFLAVGDSNFTLPIIVIIALLFLAAGGYGIYRIKKMPSVDRPLVKEKVTEPIPDAIQRRTEQIILNQINEIRNNPAVSSITKSELNAIVNTIRGINLAESEHPLKTYARKQLDSINNTLNPIHQHDWVFTRSPDTIQQLIDNEKYVEAIVESDKLLVNLARSERVYDKATAYKISMPDPDIVSLYNEGKYESVIKVYEEKQVKIDLGEKVKQLHEAAKSVGTVPDSIKKNLQAQDIETLEKTIDELNSFIVGAKPILTLTLDHTQLIADDWGSIKIQLTNYGNAPVQDVRLTFSDEFETKRIKPVTITAGATITLDIGVRQKLKGKIPLEVIVMYRDGMGLEYRETHEFSIDVVEKG